MIAVTTWTLSSAVGMLVCAWLAWDAHLDVRAAAGGGRDLRLIACAARRRSIVRGVVFAAFLAVGLVALGNPPPPPPATTASQLSRFALVTVNVVLTVDVVADARVRWKLLR